MTTFGGRPPRRRLTSRNWWTRQLHTWHWITAAVSLTGMLLFAATGFTLNHAASIGAKPRVVDRQAVLPASLNRLLAGPHPADAPLPAAVADALHTSLGLDAGSRPAEWSADEVYVAMPGPGRDAWISVKRATGAATAEVTDQGWISYLNDLHKGRNTGPVWFWFIDAFALACVAFTLTGLVILWLHARHRRSTWPLVGAGLVLPVLLAVLFIH
jgi:uncharacterized protein